MTRLLALVLLGPAALLHGASFDCAKARTAQEKAVCASPELSKADAEMSAAYRKAIEATPAEMRDEVRRDQREWLKLLPRWCPDPLPADRYRSMDECLLNRYKPRIEELNKLVQRKGGVTFVQRRISVTLPEKTDGEAGTSMEEMPGYAMLVASWPVAVSDSPQWKAWNEAVLGAAHHIVTNNASSSEPLSLGEWVAEKGQDETVEVTLEAVAPSLVTAHVEGTWWRGAHPSEKYLELNWLLNEGRVLGADDVFRRASGWTDFLYTRCDQELHQQLDTEPGDNYQNWLEPGKVAATLRSVVADPENWRLDADGLSVVFPEYSVAPRAYHAGPVMVPWSDLKPFLQTGFEPPVP